MIATSTQNQPALRLSQLAATIIVCWSIGNYTHISESNTSRQMERAAPEAQTAPFVSGSGHITPVSQRGAQAINVLSQEDATYYQMIFKAQSEGSWGEADRLIGKVKDKILIGHVLADRYFRTTPGLSALQDWLETYSDLPQAPALYAKASHMRAAKGVKLARPAAVAPWSRYGSLGASVQFRAVDDDDAVALSPQGRQLQAKAVRALRKGNALTAMEILENAERQEENPFDPKELAGINAHIAARLYYGGATVEARRMADFAMKQAHPLGLWIGGLSAWEQADFETAAAAFTTLAALPGLADWDRAAADFWAYRAMRRTGENEKAYEWLRHAALQPRSFYGFLAANLLGHKNEWSWKMPSLDKAKIDLLAGRHAGARALALAQIGQKDMAETELRRLNPQGRRGMASAMLAFAEAEQMPSLVMRVGGLALNGEGEYYDGALYPIPPWQPAGGFSVDPALIFALMRRESMFDPAAVSVSGACGLMQLMPATARMTAQVNGLRHMASFANDNRGVKATTPCSGHLLDPTVNLTLGQSYVRHLAQLEPIGDNLLMLLAAYNGGPGRLSRWAEAAAEKDPLLFIESLPVRETREYMQQVLVHYWAYSARFGQPQTVLEQLAHGEWPRMALLRSRPTTPANREAAKASRKPLALVASNDGQGETSH